MTRHALFVAAAVLALAAGTALLTPDPASGTESRFVIFLEPGPSWDYGSNFRTQSQSKRHRVYYAKVAKSGKVEMGGAIKGRDLGLVVGAPGVSRAELQEIAAEDPAVKTGVLKAQVREWMLDFAPKGARSAAGSDDGYDLSADDLEY